MGRGMQLVTQERMASRENGVTPDVRLDGRRLDICMAIAGIKTDIELARRAELNPRTITSVRSTGEFSKGTLRALGRALRCNPIDLIVTPGFPDPKLDSLVAMPMPTHYWEDSRVTARE